MHRRRKAEEKRINPHDRRRIVFRFSKGHDGHFFFTFKEIINKRRDNFVVRKNNKK